MVSWFTAAVANFLNAFKECNDFFPLAITNVHLVQKGQVKLLFKELNKAN